MNGERDLGPQPLLDVLAKHGLSATDLVEASGEQLTHKMVARAVKGRRLTANAMGKVVRALNRKASSAYTPSELFTYSPTQDAPGVRDGEAVKESIPRPLGIEWRPSRGASPGKSSRAL